MKCTFCGSEVPAGQKVCPICGVEVEDTVASSASVENSQKPKAKADKSEPVPGKVLGLVGMIIAIASLVLGFFGCCCCTWVVPVFTVISVVSLVLCIVAAAKAKKAGMKNVFAVVGIIVSAVSLAVMVISIVLWIASFFLNIGIAGIGGLGEILSELEYMLS